MICIPKSNLSNGFFDYLDFTCLPFESHPSSSSPTLDMLFMHSFSVWISLISLLPATQPVVDFASEVARAYDESLTTELGLVYSGSSQSTPLNLDLVWRFRWWDCPSCPAIAISSFGRRFKYIWTTTRIITKNCIWFSVRLTPYARTDSQFHWHTAYALIFRSRMTCFMCQRLFIPFVPSVGASHDVETMQVRVLFLSAQCFIQQWSSVSIYSCLVCHLSPWYILYRSFFAQKPSQPSEIFNKSP